MKISKRDYDRMKDKIEYLEKQIPYLKEENVKLTAKIKRDAVELRSKRELTVCNETLERSNQWFREKLAKVQGLHINSSSYV